VFLCVVLSCVGRGLGSGLIPCPRTPTKCLIHSEVYFYQALNIYVVNDGRKAEMPTAERLTTEPNPFKGKLTTPKLIRYKSVSSDQTEAEVIQAGGSILYFEIHTLIISNWNNEELPQKWKESIIVFIYKKGGKPVSSNYRAILLSQLHKNLLNILLAI
jgi:hypothetical protein